MSRPFRRYALFFFVLLLAATLAVPPAVADEAGDGGGGGEAGGDQVEQGDTGGDEDEEEQVGIGGLAPEDRPDFQNAPNGGNGGSGSEDEPGWIQEFHPTYTLAHTRDQDVGSWTHGFTMNYPLSPKLSFTASSNINTRTNDALNRLNRQETWNAGLVMNVSGAINTGVRFKRSKHVDVQNEGKANETRSARQKENVNLSTSYHKVYGNGLDISLGATAGLEKNEYTNVRSNGSTQSITGQMNYAPLSNLKTQFSYSGSHSLLDSEQGDLRSTDESVGHSLSSRIDYNWAAHKLSVDVRRSRDVKEYPKNEQTERREQESEATGITADLNLMPGLSTRIVFDYSRNQSYYRVEPTRNNDVTTRKVEGHVSYDAGATSFDADMSSEKKRNEFFDVQTGNNYSDALSVSLTHKFAPEFDVAIRGRMSLLSVQYDDVEANDQDRDLFNREASITVNYRMRNDISTGLVVRVKEDQLVYIRRSRTGDNKTTQTYSVEPFIRKSFTPRFSASQRYQLSADYTFYQYDEDSNFLIRNMTITTGITWHPFDPLDLSVDHIYRVQDEGAYVRDEFGVERYGKDSERQDQKLGIRLSYRLADIVTIEVSQNLNVQDKWKIGEEGRTRVWDKFDTSLVGKASTDYTLPDGATLKVSVARTHRDATSISERQREVWNISANLSKTF